MAELDRKAASLGMDLRVHIAGVTLSNPIMTASGTFSPQDSGEYYDLSELGAAVTKGVSAEPWTGNDQPRIAETFGGMLNSIGLENPGYARGRSGREQEHGDARRHRHGDSAR